MVTRRELLWTLAGAITTAASALAEDPTRKDHFPFGPLTTPRPLPSWSVVNNQGVTTTLAALVQGRVTALQLMFTSCNATCPIQGAIFSRAQQQLGATIDGGQFLSLSIDPGSDTPAAMTEWLKKFKAKANWSGVTPRAADLDEIFRVLGEGGMPRPQGSDPHTTQVYLIDRGGRLVYRTPAMPSAKLIVEKMGLVAGLR